MLYGAVQLARIVREMTAHSPSPILVLRWTGVMPILIMVDTHRILITRFLIEIRENYRSNCEISDNDKLIILVPNPIESSKIVQIVNKSNLDQSACRNTIASNS